MALGNYPRVGLVYEHRRVVCVRMGLRFLCVPVFYCLSAVLSRLSIRNALREGLGAWQGASAVAKGGQVV